jgi:hypothetical protein
MVTIATKPRLPQRVDGMTPRFQTLDRAGHISAEPGCLELLECGYRNGTDRMVILRCCGAQQFYLERVIFPFEVLTFHCPPRTEVEVWTHGLGGPELIETLRIETLVIEPTPSPTMPTFLEPSADDGFEDSPWLQAG